MANPNITFDSLSGPQKAAVLFLIMGEERSAEMLGELPIEELKAVTRAISSIGRLKPAMVVSASKEFLNRFAMGQTAIGNQNSAERMLMSILPEDRVNEIMEEIRGPEGKTTWDKLSNVNEAALVGYLLGEHSQTVAVILSRVRPDFAARLLAQLPNNVMFDVVRRMINLEDVPKEVVEEIENTLHSEFMVNYADGASGSDSSQILAEIFNRTPQEIFKVVVDELEPSLPEEMAKIQSLMFTFDDFIKLDAGSLAFIVREANSKTLAISLKGADDEVMRAFLGAMPERAGAILRSEMESMGPLPLREVRASQNEIVALAKRLEAAGSIRLPIGDEDEPMVV